MTFFSIPVANSPSEFLEALAIGIIDIIKHEAFTNQEKSPTLEKIATDNPKIYQPSLHNNDPVPASERDLIDYQFLLKKIITYQFPLGDRDPAIAEQLKIYNPLKILKHLLSESLFQHRYIAPLDLVRRNIEAFQLAQAKNSETKSDFYVYDSKMLLTTDELTQQAYTYLLNRETSKLYQTYIICVWLLLTKKSPKDPLYGIEIDPQLLKVVYSVMESLQLRKKIQDLSKLSKKSVTLPSDYSTYSTLSDKQAVDFIQQEEPFFIDVFCKDIFGLNYLRDSHSPIQTRDSVILSALRSMPFDRLDGFFLAEKLQINLHITTNPSDIIGEKLESKKPILILYPPTVKHSKNWQTVLMIATGTSREDLCFKHFKDSVLTVAEIQEVVRSFKNHTGYQLFTSPSKPLQVVIETLREQIIPKLETRKNVPELMSIIADALKETVFKGKHLTPECVNVKDALEYLILRFTYVNGYTIDEHIATSTEISKATCEPSA